MSLQDLHRQSRCPSGRRRSKRCWRGLSRLADVLLVERLTIDSRATQDDLGGQLYGFVERTWVCYYNARTRKPAKCEGERLLRRRSCSGAAASQTEDVER